MLSFKPNDALHLHNSTDVRVWMWVWGSVWGWWVCSGVQISRRKHVHVVLSVNNFMKQVYAMCSTRYPVFKSNAML